MNQLINAMKINAEDEERSSSIKYVSIGILQKGFPNTKIKSIKILILSIWQDSQWGTLSLNHSCEKLPLVL